MNRDFIERLLLQQADSTRFEADLAEARRRAPAQSDILASRLLERYPDLAGRPTGAVLLADRLSEVFPRTIH